MFVATGNESEPYTSTSTSTTTTVQSSQLCRHFEFGEILSATENFDESLVIGCGGSAKVYKGNIKNGSVLVVAAIKRLYSMSNEGESEFWAEVEMLSQLRHCHVVPLIGYCNHRGEMILVYEYMPHGTLADHLHKFATRLSWCQRLKMCIGAARGLDYLHTGTGIDFGIIHRDVKSSNILLDESWAAKVSDFGLSKIGPKDQQSTHVSTLVKGTFGYFDPSYFATGKVTRKSDVYAFGVVLLEVLLRKRAVDNSHEWGIATWAQDCIKEGRLREIVDFDIRGEISRKCLKRFARIAERCLDNHPKNRPTMAEVVLSLEYVLTMQEKTNNLSQNAGKTIFYRIVDKIPFSSNQNSGMDLGSHMLEKPHVGMDFRSLMPKMPHISMDFRSHMPKKPHLDIDFGSLIPKIPHISIEFGSFMHKKMKLLMLRERYFQGNGTRLLEDKLKNGVGSIKVFRAKELEKATMNFSKNRIIGSGGSGTVYMGKLDNCMVAIKRSSMSSQLNFEQFVNEIEILGQVNHRNVVRLLGCCLETEVPLLAYEFVSNKNLHHHIHNDEISRRTLSWDIRLKIAHESAGALAYLHSDATMTIIHGDVKSTNILLDEIYTAKLADFGTSKLIELGDDHVTTQVRGTFGYLDPEYMFKGQLTDKSDVYSFGVVLAELLTGLKPICSKRCGEDAVLARYFVNAKRDNWLFKIVDPHVLEESTDEQLEAACHLACRCLHVNGECRPSMKEVAMELERIRNFSKHPLVRQDLESSEFNSMHPWGSQDSDDEISSGMVESEQFDPDDFTFQY